MKLSCHFWADQCSDMVISVGSSSTWQCWVFF